MRITFSSGVSLLVGFASILSAGLSIAQEFPTKPIRMRFHTAVCHSSPFFRQSPFRPFRQLFQPGFEVDTFDEMFEMEIR